ncbi:MAG TPA: hypothetical protein ENK02_11820 [Planctomycetes bacterium]|nr:hypothetical protein [Planctomycetota bacterium]
MKTALVLSLSLLAGSPQGKKAAPQKERSPRVAIYWDKGVWEVEAKKALPALLEEMKLGYRFVSAEDIRKGALARGKKPAFDLLIVPGGWAPDYIQKLGGWDGKGRGDDALRRFLKGGGAYLGFCAGAFAAVKTTRWLGVDHSYPWRLVEARAQGPLPWNPLHKKKLGAVHGELVLEPGRREWKGRGLPRRIHPLLYGGPSFAPLKSGEKTFQVLARHAQDRSPAIILSRYPRGRRGRVLLCSFHPAVLTDDKGRWDRSKASLAKEGAGRDPDGSGPDWSLAKALVRIALGEKPARPKRVPASRPGKK